MLAQTELTFIGLIIQGGFAALCAYMIWAQEMRARRAEVRHEKEQAFIREDFAAKDKIIHEMMDRAREVVDASRELTMRAVDSIDRSTVVSLNVIEAIRQCNRKET